MDKYQIQVLNSYPNGTYKSTSLSIESYPDFESAERGRQEMITNMTDRGLLYKDITSWIPGTVEHCDTFDCWVVEGD